MKFAVLGAGNSGQAMAAHLVLLGHEVVLYSRSEDKLEKISQTGITLTNALQGKAFVKTTPNLKEAVTNSEFVMVTTIAPAHKQVFNKLRPYLKKGQTILIFPGYWGALECKQVLEDVVNKEGICIAETDSMIYTCRAITTGKINVKKVKNKISLASIPPDETGRIIDRLSSVYPQLSPAKNVLETSLNNFNPILHTPITIFNAARVDSGEEFLFYPQGASRQVVRFIERIDQERLDVGKSLGIDVLSVLGIMQRYYGSKEKELYEAIHNNKAYKQEVGPCSLSHRYVTEEIPYGLVPLSQLGRMLNISTPYIDHLIATASLLTGEDFRSQGPDLISLGLEDIKGSR